MSAIRSGAFASDQALLARAAAGDEEAFAVIYQRYRQVVFRFACAMLGTRQAADDVTHDAFLALLTEAMRFDAARASLSTYLYGIVRNLCRSHLRRHSRLQPIDVAESVSAGGHTPAAAMSAAEEAAVVRQALRELPSRYRELILLCDVHDLSYADAAHVVRASVPAVRSRLHRGRQLLRTSIAAQLGSSVLALSSARWAV